MQAERDIRARVGGEALDFAATAAVSNIYRAANVIRNRLERQILAGEVPPEDASADEFSSVEERDLSHIPGIVD